MIGGKRFFKHHGHGADTAKTYEAKDFGNGIVGFHLELQPAGLPAAPALVAVPSEGEPQPAPARKGESDLSPPRPALADFRRSGLLPRRSGLLPRRRSSFC